MLGTEQKRHNTRGNSRVIKTKFSFFLRPKVGGETPPHPDKVTCFIGVFSNSSRKGGGNNIPRGTGGGASRSCMLPLREVQYFHVREH